MEIAKCFSIRNADLRIDRLLLDPNNPRMSLSWEQPRKYSEKELCSSLIQEKVYKEILRPQYNLKNLINSIANKGFISGTDRVIVRKLEASDAFLVLEGNRRTAAIKYLSSRPEELRDSVLESIREIPVQIFAYRDNDRFSEEEVVEFLLSTIQVEGKETWGPMENAYYIYRSYMREMRRQRNSLSMTYDKEIAEYVGTIFNRKGSQLKNILSTYNVFHQLREGGYDEVNAEHYSLIDLAVKTVATRERFFEFDDEKMVMSSVGLERFSELCLSPDSPVKNPYDFSAFVYVFKYGTSYEIGQIVDHRNLPKVVKGKTQRRLEKRIFIEKLKEIKDDLELLKPVDYQGTEEEREMIQQLFNVFTAKLLKLIKS
jgi:hypothetical protein